MARSPKYVLILFAVIVGLNATLLSMNFVIDVIYLRIGSVWLIAISFIAIFWLALKLLLRHMTRVSRNEMRLTEVQLANRQYFDTLSNRVEFISSKLHILERRIIGSMENGSRLSMQQKMQLVELRELMEQVRWQLNDGRATDS